MIKKFIALAALAAGTFGAQAAPTTLAAWENSSYIQSHGMAGVNFVTSATTADGEWVALGAHPYINGTAMANDGNNTYFGDAGISPSNPNRANWSFDFAWSCVGCSISIVITDNNNAAHTVSILNKTSSDIDADGGANGAGPTWLESWNLEMAFAPLTTFAFDANSPSSTNFLMTLTNAAGQEVARTSINVTVPEPASLALVGLALGGLAFARRRKA